MKKLLLVVLFVMLFVVSTGVFADADYLEVSVPSTTREANIPAYFLLPEKDSVFSKYKLPLGKLITISSTPSKSLSLNPIACSYAL